MSRGDLTPEQACFRLAAITGLSWKVLSEDGRDLYAFRSEAVLMADNKVGNPIIVIKDPYRMAQFGPKPGWALSTSSADMFDAVGSTFDELLEQRGVMEFLHTGQRGDLPVDYRDPDGSNWPRAVQQQQPEPPPQGFGGFLRSLFGLN